MAIKRQFFNYSLDNDDEVGIRIDYSNNLQVSVEDRLTLGGFDPNDSIIHCQGLILERRLLKPRRVTVLTKDSKELDVIVKSLDTYINLLNNPETDLGNIIRSFGEINNSVKCLASV